MPAIGSSPHFGARVSGPRLGHADLTYRSAYLRFEHLGPGAALSSLALIVMASITYYGYGRRHLGYLSPRPTFFTPVTPSGTASIPSSTTRQAAASTE